MHTHAHKINSAFSLLKLQLKWIYVVVKWNESVVTGPCDCRATLRLVQEEKKVNSDVCSIISFHWIYWNVTSAGGKGLREEGGNNPHNPDHEPPNCMRVHLPFKRLCIFNKGLTSLCLRFNKGPTYKPVIWRLCQHCTHHQRQVLHFYRY